MMCEFCEPRYFGTDVGVGKFIAFQQTTSKSEIRDCAIMFHKNESPCIMVFDRCATGAYIDIEYCPMCGRKL